MSGYIELKKDNRYKKGNIVKKNGIYRGHEHTIAFKPITYPFGKVLDGDINLQNEINRMLLNPPVVVTAELADAIEKEMK